MNNQKATTFSEKSEIFLQILISNSAELAATASSITDVSYFMSASCSNTTENELEEALFFCFTKKTSDSDRIFFLIIQKTYSIISKLFYQLYSKLIIVGFHSECWKESIGIVIRKLNKDDYSNPESYRLISLLNCLGKLAEKIIAERLIYFAETADLLYFDQIDSRKQKSAIDAAISVLSDIEINKHKKKLTSILFMDVKRAFPNVNKSQLLETCCNLKLSSACIS